MLQLVQVGLYKLQLVQISCTSCSLHKISTHTHTRYVGIVHKTSTTACQIADEHNRHLILVHQKTPLLLTTTGPSIQKKIQKKKFGLNITPN